MTHHLERSEVGHAHRLRLCDLVHNRAAACGRWSRTTPGRLDEPHRGRSKRAAIHRTRYCLRYCSSADLSAEGSEDEVKPPGPQWSKHTLKNSVQICEGDCARTLAANFGLRVTSC